MNTYITNQVKQNIAKVAADEGKTQLELINELLAGAAKINDEVAIEVLLEVRRPLVDEQIDTILNR